jgi:hypothetical protein
MDMCGDRPYTLWGYTIHKGPSTVAKLTARTKNMNINDITKVIKLAATSNYAKVTYIVILIAIGIAALDRVTDKTDAICLNAATKHIEEQYHEGELYVTLNETSRVEDVHIYDISILHTNNEGHADYDEDGGTFTCRLDNGFVHTKFID